MQDNLSSQVSAWKSQLKKGTLELAILALLDAKRCYGLELLERLNELDLEVGEGSIYPLLARLRNENKVTTQWVDSGVGHAHKYYSLTPYGHKILNKMLAAWSEYTNAITGVISKVHPHE
ncbi:MAG: PadR family transcriptional regulator [Bryobacteraceae bacterium]|jgi:PadR family transcriptional regulator PadR